MPRAGEKFINAVGVEVVAHGGATPKPSTIATRAPAEYRRGIVVRDVYGREYDNAVPAFLETSDPGVLVDRLAVVNASGKGGRGSVITRSSLEALAARKGYRTPAWEIGTAPDWWLSNNPGWRQTLGGDGTGPENLYVNWQFVGGALSGPDDGSNPPDGHTIGFNTSLSRPVDNGDGTFDWEMNWDRASGRGYLVYAVHTQNPNLEVGSTYELAYDATRMEDGGANTVIAHSGTADVDVEYGNRVLGTTGVPRKVSIVFTPLSGAFTLQCRVGVGVTTNVDTWVLISNPRLTKQ